MPEADSWTQGGSLKGAWQWSSLGINIPVILLLAACSSMPETASCDEFNRTDVTFNLIIESGEEKEVFVLDVGQQKLLNVQRTVSENKEDGRMRALDCTLAWEIDPPSGVVTMSGLTITATGEGVVKITAIVRGRGEPKTDHVWVVVRPPLTEDEPNNGAALAREMVPDEPRIGLIDNDKDVDWFFARVEPGMVYQVTFGHAFQLPDDLAASFKLPQGQLYTYELASQAHDQEEVLSTLAVNEDALTEVSDGLNKARANSSSEALYIFVKVNGSGGEVHSLPYRLDLGLLPSTVNIPPVAVDDEGQTTPDTAVEIDLLSNDRDPDGHGLVRDSLTITREPLNGTVEITDRETASYTPNEGFVGTDIFFYTVKDRLGAVSNEATVLIRVQPVSVSGQ